MRIFLTIVILVGSFFTFLSGMNLMNEPNNILMILGFITGIGIPIFGIYAVLRMWRLFKK